MVVASVAVLLAVGEAGCGGGASSSRALEVSAPRGHLTGAEYGAMRAAISVEKRIAHKHTSWEKKAAQFGSACVPLNGQATALLTAEAADCGRQTVLLQRLASFAGDVRACAGDVNCLESLFGTVGRSSDDALATARTVNERVRARGLRRGCATQLSDPPRVLSGLAQVRDGFASARDALAAGNRPGYLAAARQMKAGIKALGSSPNPDPAKLAACHH